MKTTQAREFAAELCRVAGMFDGETVAAVRDNESDVETEALQQSRAVMENVSVSDTRVMR